MNTTLDTKNRNVVRIPTMCEINEVLIIYKYLKKGYNNRCKQINMVYQNLNIRENHPIVDRDYVLRTVNLSSIRTNEASKY